MDILHALGNTSMVRLRRVPSHPTLGHPGEARGGKIPPQLKDRMGRPVIARAEGDGRLKPGDTVVEYTGGSTGASLAWSAPPRYRLQIVSSDWRLPRRSWITWGAGAELTLVRAREAAPPGS